MEKKDIDGILAVYDLIELVVTNHKAVAQFDFGLYPDEDGTTYSYPLAFLEDEFEASTISGYDTYSIALCFCDRIDRTVKRSKILGYQKLSNIFKAIFLKLQQKLNKVEDYRLLYFAEEGNDGYIKLRATFNVSVPKHKYVLDESEFKIKI